ncbi:MAG: hypothetical protein J6V24_07935 [Clostridia bacterium]|nr:hypothetical protein [Clostridia bacterium]
MSDRKTVGILIAVAAAGLIITAAHAVYLVFAYQNASIIQFIARELWL